MDIQIIDHGQWESYTPDPMPAWVTEMGPQYRFNFARRVSDGVDWYEFVHRANAFQDNPVVCSVLVNPADGVETVKAVTRDPQKLFPGGQRLIEITGHDVEDDKPHNEFAWLTYDPATKTLNGSNTPELGGNNPLGEALPDWRFFTQLAIDGIITPAEAEATSSGEMPQLMKDALAMITDPGKRLVATMKVKNATMFYRKDDMVAFVAGYITGLGEYGVWDDARLDKLWADAKALGTA